MSDPTGRLTSPEVPHRVARHTQPTPTSISIVNTATVNAALTITTTLTLAPSSITKNTTNPTNPTIAVAVAAAADAAVVTASSELDELFAPRRPFSVPRLPRVVHDPLPGVDIRIRSWIRTRTRTRTTRIHCRIRSALPLEHASGDQPSSDPSLTQPSPSPSFDCGRFTVGWLYLRVPSRPPAAQMLQDSCIRVSK